MPYVRKYLTTNVLDAARERISTLFDQFDSLAVMFSGGKDSWTCVNLVKDEAFKRGIKKIDVIFIDKEIFNPSIIKYMEQIRLYDWINMHWVCVPSKNSKFFMGQSEDILLWDPEQEDKWLRPMPPWAITLRDNEKGLTFGSRDMDGWIVDRIGMVGKPGLILGLRAAESIIRYRSVMNKLHQPYLASSPCSDRVSICKPIYDWQDDDVYKYLGENKIGWCPIYDLAHLSGGRLRTSTPINAEAAKVFDTLRRMEPEFYQKIVNRWPEMMIHERYWKDFDMDLVLVDYLADGLEGCRRYIEEKIDDEQKKQMAYKRLGEFEGLQKKSIKAYPSLLLLKHLVNGVYYRPVNPLSIVGQGEYERAEQRILAKRSSKQRKMDTL